MFCPEKVDRCLYLRGPSSTIPGARACNKFRKGTDQSYQHFHSPETSAEATPRGEAAEALFISVGDSYQELGRQDSAWGPTLWARCRPSRTQLRQAPRTSSRKMHSTGCSPRSRLREKPYCFQRVLLRQEWRALKSSGGRPPANALSAPLCQLKGAPRARATLAPKLEATRAQSVALRLRRPGPPETWNRFPLLEQRGAEITHSRRSLRIKSPA